MSSNCSRVQRFFAVTDRTRTGPEIQLNKLSTHEINITHKKTSYTRPPDIEGATGIELCSRNSNECSHHSGRRQWSEPRGQMKGDKALKFV